jgi:hypothetical protein
MPDEVLQIGGINSTFDSGEDSLPGRQHVLPIESYQQALVGANTLLINDLPSDHPQISTK